ncbi:pre-peptidase C-terminal domain-containing protein [Halalkaliarchaeum sp. AArc-GB]|uniref:pre-peptidase C-terminal domain-containing protein n=1 Tax=Halalkaliarchaeum sp. AArc-GB TaxID=3074078 RepID=UPI00285F61DF|nr:pre-peptidase C-terminal domain-containing protein [Halalkaliarchaeum sp. AArc-GB]MDR5671677.1 pre-peptidase C-terminal domain-containing protein [Halalkaliarchaeum sp. AArc-GB]
MSVNRRSVLVGVLTVVPLSIAGCLGDDDLVVSTSVDGSQTFRFEAEEDDDIVVAIDNQDGDFTAVELTTVDDRGTALSNRSVEDEAEITVDAPETGRYELSIVAAGTASVTVRLQQD